jgi:hypothetical protein
MVCLSVDVRLTCCRTLELEEPTFHLTAPYYESLVAVRRLGRLTAFRVSFYLRFFLRDGHGAASDRRRNEERNYFLEFQQAFLFALPFEALAFRSFD